MLKIFPESELQQGQLRRSLNFDPIQKSKITVSDYPDSMQ